MNPMRLGIVADHAGFALKEQLLARLHAAGHETIDFGARFLESEDDDPDLVVPLARAVAAGEIQKAIATCGSGVGAAVSANKIAGVRAALIHDHFSARQGVDDDHMNVLCLGGRTEGPAIAWDLVQTFLAAEFSQAARHPRRLGEVTALEEEQACRRGKRRGGRAAQSEARAGEAPSDIEVRRIQRRDGEGGGRKGPGRGGFPVKGSVNTQLGAGTWPRNS